jgi:prepilin-type processing-associated H-X9-DG protein
MRQSIIWVTVTILGLCVLACAGMAVPIEFAITLAFGWVIYLGRVLPNVGIAWGGVVTATLCLALFLAGSHAFLAWLYGQLRAGADPGGLTVQRWKPWWTVAFGALIVLMFVAGISAVGVVHQVGWLLASDAPLVENSSRGINSRLESVNHLKQIGMGLHDYHNSHKTFPPAGTFDAVGRPLHGWQTRLLPFLEQEDLHDSIDFEVPWDHPRNAPAFQTELPVYRIPMIPDRKDEAGYALSHYAGNAHVLGGDVSRTLGDVKDGGSSTIMAGEVASAFTPWGYPANWRDPALGINRSPEGFGSPFPGGANFLFVDGSVRFLKNTIDPQVLKALSTPTGGEPVSTDSY